MRLTKTQKMTLMRVYFWYLFNETSYWWAEDANINPISMRSLIRRGLVNTLTEWSCEHSHAGYEIARDLWRKDNTYRPLFLQYNAAYGDGAP